MSNTDQPERASQNRVIVLFYKELDLKLQKVRQVKQVMMQELLTGRIRLI